MAGTIPAMRMQTVLSSGNKAPGYAAGQGDLAGLTRAGAGILPPAPQGGPFMRQALSHALFAGAGAGYGGYGSGAEGALAGAAVGAGLPKVAGTLLRAPPVQAYLKNQVAPGIGRSVSPLAAALAAYAPARRYLI